MARFAAHHDRRWLRCWLMGGVASLLLSSLCALSAAAETRRVNGAELPETLELDGTSLLLNGAGTRNKYFVDVYVAGLYLEHKNSDGPAIVAADRPMAIRLHVISRLVTPSRLQSSIREGFERSTRGNTEPFRDEIETLVGVYRGPIAVGDAFDVAYRPGRGVEVYANGERTAVIPAGLAFKRALFGIWLSDHAVQASLREALLGR